MHHEVVEAILVVTEADMLPLVVVLTLLEATLQMLAPEAEVIIAVVEKTAVAPTEVALNAARTEEVLGEN